MSKHFTHLHLHSEFSLLDGAIRLDRLIDFGKEYDFKSLAITDHGNIFGAVKFFQMCKKAGIKPILGMEAYFTPDASVKSVERKYNHLIIIVQNAVGYKNLCKLISYSYQKGFYFKPRIDYQILEKHSEGLIVTTACLGGHIPKLLMQEQYSQAEERIDWFVSTFGRDRFYFEIQPEEQAEQKELNQKLYEWSAKKDISLLAAGDCHYLLPENHEAHEVMLSIQTQNKITDPNRFTFGDVRAYVKTPDEMLELFRGHEDAVWNSGKIADMCDFDFETGKLFFPKFKIPKEHTADTFFKELCTIGLQKLIDNKRVDGNNLDSYWARLNLEIDLIVDMGFVGYFLVVSDFIQWARRNGIPVGPGRGSAAGSLVAWALEITNIDPLKYNLLFERFLNPERVTMPDIDIDFCIEGRETVINYCRDKYGHDNVGQIITFGTMMAKGVLKDVARVLGLPFEDANHITSLIPDQLKISIKDAREQEPRLNELIESNPTVAKTFEIGTTLEGLTRHASKHAAGIVISPEPIDEVLPVYVPSKSTEIVTQYAMTELESIGFLKIDLLGLKNLTLVDRVIKQIAKNHNVKIDIDHIPLDDAKTFELLQAGKTSGVFQLESEGLKEVLRKLKPEKFEDIIAVNALYRPGPLGSGMVDDFIERKHGRQKITYLFDELEPILKETNGVIVYQEQVMKIASTIGGYSLGEADILRRAMGKKKVEVMAEQRELFLKRAVEKKFAEKKAGELFDLMAYFAGYGFNKSHSAAYALIAYQTAYLKAHYPAEFMACLISLEATHPDKMSFYLDEAKEMHLDILPPNINQSHIDFTVVEKKLLFGLQGIKNVGHAALEAMVAEQEKKPFIDLLDFCIRLDLRVVNKRVIESLICAGAFDTLAGNRAQQFEELETIINRAIEEKKARATGQMGLFAQQKKAGVHESYNFTPLENWDNKQILEKEKEVIGFYLSAHPLDAYKKYIEWLSIPSFEKNLRIGQETNTLAEPTVIGCGLMIRLKQIVTKKGDPMAFVQLEDGNSKAEIIVFPKLFKRVEAWLKNYDVFIVKGNLDTASDRMCKILANDMVPVELFFEEWPQINEASLILPEGVDQTKLAEIKKTLTGGKINFSIQFKENNTKLKIRSNQRIALDTQIISTLQEQNIDLKLSI